MKAGSLKNIFKYKRFSLFFWFFGFAVLLSFFLRVYKLPDFLGFYFDQGRDALVIWDFLRNGKLFLVGPTIGPTMGVGDVPRGPWYYLLITPFYWLGKGNPLYPSVFLIFTTVVASFLLALLSFRSGGFYAGVLSLVLSCFSFDFVLSSRWFANPTPLYLISVLFLFLLFGVINSRLSALFMGALLSGLAFHFGSSADLFYLPILFLAAFIFARNIFTLKNIFICLILYFLSFLPQLIFDLRHNGVIRKGLVQFIESGRFYNLSFETIIYKRILYYPEVFFNKIWPQNSEVVWILLFVFLFLIWFFRKNLFSNKYFLVSAISLLVPMFFMMFFKGEKGVIYDYYFTGFFFIFIFVFSFVFSRVAFLRVGKFLFWGFIFAFLFYNFSLFDKYFKGEYRRYNPISLSDEIKAVDWVYKDAGEKRFNVDFYVPPVIPYSYEYLFKWRGTEFFDKTPLVEVESLLYTISEPDPSHPDRLDAWRKRQDKIGETQEKIEIGSLLVEKRVRIADK